jgi:hypothetical protein
MKAPGNGARDQTHEAHQDHERERVRRRRQRFAGEDLAALARTRQDRFQRSVVTLRRDDVTGDERGHQRQSPDGHEEKDDEGNREARVADIATQWYVVRATGLQLSTTTKMIGTTIATPRPR